MKQPKKPFSFRISARQLAFAEERATEADLTISAWIARLIDREIEARDAPATARKKPAR